MVKMDKHFYLKKEIEINSLEDENEILEMDVYHKGIEFEEGKEIVVNTLKMKRGKVKVFDSLKEAENIAKAFDYEVCEVPAGFFAI